MRACSSLIISWLALSTAVRMVAAQISSPTPGFVRFDKTAVVQTILGVPGSFVLGPPTGTIAEAASFSDKAGLVADASSIKLINRQGLVLAEYRYASATPVLSVTDEADSAIAWLPGAHTLLTYNGHSFDEVGVTAGHLPGIVTSVSFASPKWASLLLMQTDGSVSEALVSLPEGEVASIDLLPGVEGPAYRFGESMLWRDNNGLQIESMSTATRHSLPVPPGRFLAERMSTQWLHLFFTESKSHWALQLDRAQPVLSRLPCPAPSSKETSR